MSNLPSDYPAVSYKNSRDLRPERWVTVLRRWLLMAHVINNYSKSSRVFHQFHQLPRQITTAIMDLLQTVRKEGSRGGRAEFKWEDVKGSQHRENYLGHSLMARE